ncbi:MAG: hypothetical protein SGI88_17260 [Candidatus Hydrogenedentes bacterium]|nr:hypothetical protein [Candidatus Hydrogenedentota bacterium]
MNEEIENAVRKLGDTKAGWVTRRDSAEYLGKLATKALGALHSFGEEMDVDVRRAVDEWLGRSAAIVKDVKPVAGAQKYTLEELVKSVAKDGSRDVEREGEDFIVQVTLKDGRTQSVHVREFKREDGMKLVQVYCVCGKADESAYAWALRANMKLIQGAVALSKQGDDERFVLSTCFLATEITKMEIKAAIKETAYYGDWIEQKLSKHDEF